MPPIEKPFGFPRSHSLILMQPVHSVGPKPLMQMGIKNTNIMTRLILVTLSGILSICCLFYAAYTIIINEPTSIGFTILIIGCILFKVWQWLINTDSDVDMYIE